MALKWRVPRNGDVENYIATRSKPDMKMKLDWILAIADALEYMHNQKVIHNDIVMKNILLSGNLVPKLIEFSNTLLESEQLECDRYYTEHSDIFDFASVAYSILTWNPYNIRLIEYQINFNQDVHDTRPPRGWPPAADLPQMDDFEFKDFLLGCWLKKFETMQDVQKGLCRQIAREETKAGPTVNTLTRIVFPPLRWFLIRCGALFLGWRKCFRSLNFFQCLHWSMRLDYWYQSNYAGLSFK